MGILSAYSLLISFNHFGSWIKSTASTYIYCAVVVCLYLFETTMRTKLSIPKTLSIQWKNKQFLFGILFFIIAAIGYLFDAFLIDALDLNCTYKQFGYVIHNIFSSIALSLWYLSIYGEDWSMNTNKKKSKQLERLNSTSSPTQKLSFTVNPLFTPPINPLFNSY